MVMNLPNGHLLQNGKYKLTHAVGQGGFGITYKGIWYTEAKGPLGTVKTEVPVCVKEFFFKDYCQRDTRTPAVKVHSETGRTLFHKFKEKLIKEAKILSEVHHPYIVNVLEVFEENNTAYIAMEYIDGFSLKYRMDQEGVLPEERLFKYIGQIGEALEFVHRKNILHLDIKPSNILIDKYDNARLIDFGVSKRYDIDQQETSTTILTLSKGFASIEQYDDEGTQNFSPCPDIYSLGATMYNLLTGKIPTESILRATRPLLNPRELNPAVSPRTEAVILKAMQIVPANRFQTIAEMLQALDISLPEPAPSAGPCATHATDSADAADSKQPAKTTDTSREMPAAGEDEETTVLGTGRPSLPLPEETDEDEATVVNLPPTATPPAPKKKRSWLVAGAVGLVAVGASAVAMLVRIPQPAPAENTEIARSAQANPTGSPVTPVDSTSPTPEEKVEETHMETPAGHGESPSAQQDATERRPENTRQPVDQPVLRIDTPSEEEKTQVTAAEPEPAISVAPPAVESPDPAAETVYQAALAAGKAKMAASDYEGAKQEFIRAKEAKLTEEVVRLMIANDEKAEEKQIADRRALYEEKMDFGLYKIVRKKSSGRYGAIDAKGNEHIPCRYLSVGKADNGRAFEREDNLFDIYSPEGVLISKGATYY